MQDYFAVIFETITRVLSQHSSTFESAGMDLFHSFAIIRLVSFGLYSGLAAAEGGPGFSFARCIRLCAQLILVRTMLAYYSVPIPGLGVSFTHLVLDQVTFIVNTLGQNQVQDVIQALDNVETFLPAPSVYEVAAGWRFMILILAIATAQAVALMTVMFGYIATAVLLLFGPLFIPFFIVPSFSWMFESWIRAFLQYAFYQAVAAAYTLILGSFIIQSMGLGQIPMTTEQVAVMFGPMLMALIVFILGLVKIPALVTSLFFGRSGDSIFLFWK